MRSPKIKRAGRARSRELAQWLTRCGVPPTPPREERRALEDATTSTRRALADLMEAAGLLAGWTAKHADDLARLAAAVPEPARSLAHADAAARAVPHQARGLRRGLARALIARNACADAHMRLAVEHAIGTAPAGPLSRLKADDLAQECMLAILHTAEVYDRWHLGAGRHSSFSNAAGWWLRHYAERALREQGHDFRPPGAALSSRTRVMRARDRLRGLTGAEPSVAELAAAAGKIPRVTQQVVEWADGGYTFDSADRVLRGVNGRESRDTWLDVRVDPGPDPADAAGRAATDAVGAAVDELPAEQRDVVRALNGIGCDKVTVRELARRTGRTRGRIEALAAAAAEVLRERLAPLAADLA